MDRIDAESTLVEIQTLQFFIGEYLSKLANLSVAYERNEEGAAWKLAHEVARFSDHLNGLHGLLQDKINELEDYTLTSYEQKQEPTSSANEVSH